MEHTSNKKEYLSLLNVLSAFAVVVLHTNNCFWTFSTERYWFTANIIESVMYFAVPVFFMITGATLISYRERYSTKEYFRRRFWKAVFPFVIWSILGIFIHTLRAGAPLSNITLRSILNELVNAPTIYWFFIPLFCIYLSIPLFAQIPPEKRKVLFGYLAVICFIINSLIPFLFELIPWNIELSLYWDIGMGCEYLLYVLIGYLLHNYPLKKAGRYSIYALALAGLLIHMCGTYNASMEAGYLIQQYKGYCNVPAVLYSTGIFLFFRQAGPGLMKWWPLNRFIHFIKPYTFGIYLLHWHLIMCIVNALQINIYSIVYRLGFPFVLIGLCLMLLFLLRKIPGVRRIVP